MKSRLCELLQSQATYSAFVSGSKISLNHVKTICDISDSLSAIEDTIWDCFIPAITGGRIYKKEERKLFTLPSRYGGLAIPIFHKETKAEYNNSRRNTTELTRLIWRKHMKQTVELTTKNINKKSKKKLGQRTYLRGSRLSDLISEKRNLPKSVITHWIRLSLFCLIKMKLSLFT